jgi:hypothetical protein
METLEEFIKEDLKNLFVLLGIYPYLCALDVLEKRGKFEECKIILDVIKEMSVEDSENYPTKLTEEVTKEYLTLGRVVNVDEFNTLNNEDVNDILTTMANLKYDYNILVMSNI